MCPNEKCPYVGEIDKKGVCPLCGTKAKEYTSWLGEVGRLKNRKMRYQESLKHKIAIEEKAEKSLRMENELKRREGKIEERELLRKEEEIIGMQGEMKRKEWEIIEKENEISREMQRASLKTKNALYASAIIISFGIILIFLSPILVKVMMYNFLKSILTEILIESSSSSMIDLLSPFMLLLPMIIYLAIMQILGVGLIFIGSAGIIASLIYGYGKIS
jgi:hypothetical protein